MSDYNQAGIVVGHNVYILLQVTNDLIQGFSTDASERRHISASKADIHAAIGGLRHIIDQINKADTSQDVMQ